MLSQMGNRIFHKIIILLFQTLLLAVPCKAQADLTSEIIRDKITQIRFFEQVKLGEAPIASTRVLPEIYEQRQFEPLWKRASNVTELIDAVGTIKKDGLNPRDYHYNELRRYHRTIQAIGDDDPWLAADFDILLTDSLIRLVYHLYFGKVDPTTFNPGWNLTRRFNLKNPARAIQDMIIGGLIATTIDSLKPQYPGYRRLKAALAKYEKIQSAGGWPVIPAGAVMRKGDRGPRIALLRKRLAATDGAPQGIGDPELFDDALESAVKRFQLREEIDSDGIVGRPTLNELNYPVTGRIDQIRANLERLRWFLHDLPEKFVVVDIAGFTLDVYTRNRIIWTARAQVGDPYTQTPCFKTRLKYMVFNPTWTVPPGIAGREYLPKLIENPDFLSETDLKVIDSDGREINPAGINWKRYANRRFPYRFFQAPGPENPLGRIKFICPNPYYVYLHDTPEAEKFREGWRAFSAGCIRVEKPLEFAVLLMDNENKWNLDKIRKSIESGRTRTVFLPRKMPIMFLYFTVRVEYNEMIHFRDDIYGRDDAVIKGLNAPFEFKHPGEIYF